MRYRATIYCDVFTDNKQEAEEIVSEIVSSIKNAYMDEVVRMPHGSELSFDEGREDDLISKKGGH